MGLNAGSILVISDIHVIWIYILLKLSSLPD